MEDITNDIRFKTLKEYKTMNICELQERLHNRLTDYHNQKYVDHKKFVKKQVLSILKAMKYRGDTWEYKVKLLLSN